jgi:drug/metabolite transporter (DMT)-like permease
MRTMIANLSARTAFLMTMPPLLWAGNAVVGRLMVGSFPPLALNFMRWAIAALLLTLLGWRVLREPSRWLVRWRYLLPLGLLGVGAYNALQYQALVTSTPLNVTLIASTSPVWILMVGALFYGEPVRRWQVLGAALSIGGATLVVARGSLEQLLAFRLVPGDVYVLIAIIAWAVYSWMLAKPPVTMKPPLRPTVVDNGQSRDLQWSEFLLVQTLFGLLGAGAAALGEQALGAAPASWGWSTVAALIYVALGPSIIAYRCWGLGIARGGPALATSFANLTPVFAAIMSVMVLGEAPRWYHVLAFALIVAGILVSSHKPKVHTA